MYEQPAAAQVCELDKRVLVVDDDQDMRILLHAALESEGYQVATAAGGTAAVEFLTRAEDAWIVLMDVMMPDLGGLEVCSRLHAAGPTAARHRVALMTGGKLELKECPPPARRLLRKPFRLDTVYALVAALAHDPAERENGPAQPKETSAGEQHL